MENPPAFAVWRRLSRGTCCLLFTMCCCACVSHQSLVAIVPDDSGHTGSAIVTNTAGRVILDEPNEAVILPGTGSDQTRVITLHPEDIQRTFSSAIAAIPPGAKTFYVYFNLNSAEAEAESLGVFDDIAEAVRQNNPIEISIRISIDGYTDRAGTEDYNQSLAMRRAHYVENMLQARGLEAIRVTIASHGERDPEVATANGAQEPRNRRVVVVVH